MSVAELEPKECFKWFADISRIPRGSGHEKAISDHLVQFAQKRGLQVVQDANNNVLIRKPGTKGFEKAPVVILQGHMDMVWVKEESSPVDFMKDPITLRTDGDLVTAEGTTLGADNGVAVAYILALLDSKDIPHPPLEALITTEEEVGLTGATHFDVGLLSGSLLINMDHEVEGEFCTSCAGGRRSVLSMPLRKESVANITPKEGFCWYTLTVTGLTGGHSGLEIHKARGNSNRLLGRVLSQLRGQFSLHLAKIEGGIAANVIPRESKALIFAQCDQHSLQSKLDELCAIFKNELKASDGAGLVIQAEKSVPQQEIMAEETFNKLLAAILILPDGVLAMDLNMKEQSLVESSDNLAQLQTKESSIEITCSSRSSISSKKEFIYSQILAVASLIGATVEYSGDYPAWEYNPESSLRGIFKQAYRDLFAKDAVFEGVHAGLECGIFYEKLKALGRTIDIISFGPTITGAHSTHETLSRSSTENVWKLLLEGLKRIGSESM